MLFSYFFSNTRKLHGPAILHVRCAVYNLKWPQYAVSSKVAACLGDAVSSKMADGCLIGRK